LADKLVDINFPITKVTTLHVVLELPCSPTTSGIRQFEGPKEVRGLFEVRASSDDLMHEILDAKDVVFSKTFLDDSIVAQRDALFVDLSVPALVNQFTNRFQIGFTINGLKSGQPIVR
jgi:hypothetical protein